MRAVWYDRQGAADEVLTCGELPTPEAGHGEVRVRLEASGVNPSDTYRRRGPPAMEYPRVVTNSDGAGVVDQVGPGHKGPHVTEVLSVDSSTSVPTASRRLNAQATTLNGPSVEETGTVKWFNADKGYGFIATNGGGKDVFVHISALDRSGIAALSEGQTVVVDVVEGRKGPEAARIRLI